MTKRYIISTAICLAIASTSPVQAGEKVGGFDFSATTAFVSQFSFRGLDQSDESPAVQGIFDVTHDSGVYAGIFGSSNDLNDNDEANLEVDIYAGYTNTINNFSYDIGAIYYAFPGADSSLDYDFYELAFAVGYDFGIASTSVSFNYSPEFFGDSGDATYVALSAGVPLPSNFSLAGHLGYQTIEDEAAFFGTATSPQDSFLNWSIGLTYAAPGGFDLSVRYVDTDLSEPAECPDGCQARGIFGISKTF